MKNDLTAAQILRRRRYSSEVRSGYVSLIVRLVMIFIFGWIFLTKVFLVTQAHGNEMFPAVKDGDLVLAYRLQGDYLKNDLVVYDVDGEQKVGRILGRETDVIMMDETGLVTVNGTTQTGEILYPTYAGSEMDYPFTVPDDSVYILCDYRTNGTDSRVYGAISLEDVKGKVLTILRRRGL